MNHARSVVLLSALLLGSGLLIAIEPSIGDSIEVPRIGVSAIAVLAVGLALLRVWHQVRSSSTFGLHTILSTSTDPIYPGDELKHRLDAIQFAEYATTEGLAGELREEFEAIAVETLTEQGEVSETEARSQLRQGTWTADAQAAAFFTCAESTIGDHIRSIVRNQSPFVHRAKHAARELIEKRDVKINQQSESVTNPPTVLVRPTTVADTVSIPVTRKTNRWHGLSVVALGFLAIGVIARNPSLILLSVFPISALVLVNRSTPPSRSLEVTRHCDSEDPALGDEVTITVTVENTGDRLLSDIRLVDGVPTGVEILNGSPRVLTALRPSAQTTFEYTIRTGRGQHHFSSPLVVLQDATGVWERVDTIPTDPIEFSCPVSLDSLPVRQNRLETTQYVGPKPHMKGGSGQQFHSLREYVRGDSLKRIAWNHRAKTGDFATINFHEPHRSAVVFLLDARRSSFFVGRDEFRLIEHEIDAVRRLAPTILDDGHRVGVASMHETETWIDPGQGLAHRSELEQFLSYEESLQWRRPQQFAQSKLSLDRVLRRLTSDTHVVFISPLCDDEAVEFVTKLQEASQSITVISPDPTRAETLVHVFAQLHRAHRISRIRRTGTTVLDWEPDTPLAEIGLAKESV